MKFELSLKYNSVPEWQDSYLNYSGLKKVVYSLQAEEIAKLSDGSNELDKTVDRNEEAQGNNFSNFFKKKNKVVSDAFKEHSKTIKDTVNVHKDKASSSLQDSRKVLKDAMKKAKLGSKSGEDSFDTQTYELSELAESGSIIKKGSSSALENTFSLTEVPEGPAEIFLARLREELAKIDGFYRLEEEELDKEFNQLVDDLETSKILHIVDNNDYFNESKSILSNKSSVNQAIIESTSAFNLGIDKDAAVVSSCKVVENGYPLDQKTTLNDDEDDDDDVDHSESENSALLGDSDLTMNLQRKITLKKRTTQLYVDLCQLKSYVELNRMGFNKITKKFDKSLNTTLKADLFDNNVFFKESHTFEHKTMVHLDNKINTLVEFYGSLTGQLDNLAGCKAELKSFLKEQIVWERNTVWKDLLGIEAKSTDLKAGESLEEQELFRLDYYSWALPYPVNFYFFKWENFKIPKFIRSSRTYKLVIIIAVTAVLLGVKTFNDEAEHRCMALLACVALLWATEAIPLFVTAMLCPLLCVLFRVVKDDDGKVLSASDASSYVLSEMWSTTIMVLIAGFTLAAGLSKYNIAKVLASYILAFSGTKPRNILLSIMSVAMFLSMWISNVASPVLCYSLIQGVLRTLTYDNAFAKTLILGVALASDLAGMSSPISSPQNIVAMTYLQPYGIGWGQWLEVAIPVSVISLILVWLLLILTFDISKTKVMQYKPIKEKFTIKQWFVCFVTVGTIILWCVLTKIESAFGDSGEIAVIPIVLLFGTGMLNTSDVNNFPWTIVLLAMGSLALGKAVSSSGLLSTIAKALQRKIEDFDIFVILIIFGILILVIATFVSHTVSAIIIIPLVQEIGDSLPGKGSAVILIFGIGLLSSCGMGLASSGFPNVTAISMTDDFGNRYLDVSTFITRGVPASLIAYIVIITVGYGIMISMTSSL